MPELSHLREQIDLIARHEREFLERRTRPERVGDAIGFNFTASGHGSDGVLSPHFGGVKVDGDDGSVDHTGGKWIFSVSGQVFQSTTIQGRGEILRLISGSGSRGYSLALRDDDTGDLLPFQILSLDGVPIDSTSPNINDFAAKAGNRFVQAACGSDRTRLSHPVCATVLRMMPSAGSEIFFSSHLGQTRHATFITQALQTGLPEIRGLLWDWCDWPSTDRLHQTTRCLRYDQLRAKS